MKRLLQILSITILTLSCQTESQLDKEVKKPDFKTALIKLLKEYPDQRLNNENDAGKLGFCVEAHPGGIITANYTYDKINGRLEVYNRTTGEIQYIDSLVNGESVGPIWAYNDNGSLAYTITNIAEPDTVINNEYYKNYSVVLHAKKPTAQIAHLIFLQTHRQSLKNQKSYFLPTLKGN
jgi:hypothetical protein